MIGPAQAQSWNDQYPELTLAAVPTENADATIKRLTPLAAYLSKAIGVPVKLSRAKAYTAVIEMLRFNQHKP